MVNRYRNERIEIKLTEEEKKIFQKKLKMSKCKNMAHFIKKYVLEKKIFVIDMSIFKNVTPAWKERKQLKSDCKAGTYYGSYLSG